MHRIQSSGGPVARRRHHRQEPTTSTLTTSLHLPLSSTENIENTPSSHSLPPSRSDPSFQAKTNQQKSYSPEKYLARQNKPPPLPFGNFQANFDLGLSENRDLGGADNSRLEEDFSFSVPTEMPCRERTAEFRTAAKSLQMKQQANGFSQKPKRKSIADSVVFNNKAKEIGRYLSQTCAKVEKLAMLSKKKSLFNDGVSEIDHLTSIIKEDISGLNKKIGDLQNFVSTHQLGTPGFEAQKGAGGRPQGQNHSRSVVVGLQSRLATVSTEFKQALEVRTENLKQQKSRREKFSQSQPIPSSLPPSASSGNMGSVLLSDEYAASNGFVSLDMDNIERQRVQQQVQLIDEQDAYVQARSNAMESIESSVVELGSIFRQLAHLVSEQGETIQRIDTHVDETALNVEAAHMELLKYFRSISSNRWLAIKVFGVLIAFFIIFIVFMT